MRSEQAATVKRLERLSRLRDYDVDRGEPDPRGWAVLDRSGRAVGEVKDLIVDTNRMVAIYLDVELDRKIFDLRDDDPHVFVPVGRARTDGKRIVADDLTPDLVAELRTARERQWEEFWDTWWSRSASTDRDATSDRFTGTRLRRRAETDDLRQVIDEVRPGETVRIPVVNEEIVVERREVGRREVEREALVTNRAVDEPPRRR